MTTFIVHLSDIHFDSRRDNPLASRASDIAVAVSTVPYSPNWVLVVVTGDIAYSGKATEYAIAEKFFADLDGELKALLSEPRVDFAFVPGNHDCDFEHDNKTRTLILDALARSPSEDIDDSMLQQATSVQAEFRTFAEKFVAKDHVIVDHSLCRKLTIVGPTAKAVINCYNTAWLSRIHERQGSLCMPEGCLVEQSGPADLVLTAFHHPYAWLNADNARAFRRHIERATDIILTGHEHECSSYSKLRGTGERIEYFEGAVLQDSKDGEGCGFNVAVVGVEEQELRLFEFEFQDGYYCAETLEPQVQPFARNRNRLKGQFEVSSEAQAFLDDPGANFTHPHKSPLLLSDVYVAPDLEELSVTSESQNSADLVIQGETYYNYLVREKKLLIIGKNESGKTAFAKNVYRDLRSNGIIPVMINGI